MSARRFTRFAATLGALVLALALAAPRAHAGLGEPDESYREAQLALRDAQRDTLGHGADPAKLDALGDALLKLARLADAAKAYRRALAAQPNDAVACAGLAHIALCEERLGEADSLLAHAGDGEDVAHDRYVLMLRRHDWAAAAQQAELQGEGGRRELFERLAEQGESAPPAGPDRVVLPFARAWPAPLVRVLIAGQNVLAAIDPSAEELLVDPATARNAKLAIVPGERSLTWNGSRAGARNAIVGKLAFGKLVLTNVPAAITPLHRYSLVVNPEGEGIGAVIGLPVLERLGLTIDFHEQRLELRRPGVAYDAAQGTRVPFERWGERLLVVRGSIAGGRRLALVVGTGLPEGGLGAPQATFDEAGLQPGKFANLVRGVGSVLQGVPWSQVILPTLAIGPIVKDRLPGWSGAMDASEMWRYGMRLDGVLGPRFFANRRVTFDWAKRELLFEGE